MAFISVEPRVIEQAIADTSTTQKHPLGTRIRAVDTTLGEGEFIYLKGVGSTVVGSVVTYNNSAGTTTLAGATALAGLQLAVAMSANVANQYGWYQVKGPAYLKKNATTKVAPGAKVYLAGSGVVTGTLSTGKAVVGGVCIEAATVPSATTLVLMQLDHCAQEGDAVQ